MTAEARPGNRSAAPWPPEWAKGLFTPDIDEEAVYLATEAAGWLEGAVAERRAFALLALASIEARRAGGARLPLGPALRTRLARLSTSPADLAAAGDLARGLLERPDRPPLLGGPGDYRPFVVEGQHLYQERDRRIEERLAAALAARLRSPALPVADRAAALEAATTAGRRWTPSQAAALEAALGRRLTVIAGGPGSGKTAIIGALVRGWMALGLSREAIAIAAPTGKAANRIAESLADGGPAPGTLHRLLGYSADRPRLRTGDFRYHENRRLPHAAVIVDEASMIDLALLDQLTRALRPDARLVLLGDADQLPAIEAGSVLRDLDAVALRLAESHRMNPDDPAGAAVLDAARAVASGTLGDRGTPALDRPAELPWTGFACLQARDPSGARRLRAAFVGHWYATFLRPAAADARAVGRRLGRRGELDPDATLAARALLDRHRRARLLTVTRVGPSGADQINEDLDRLALGDFGGGGPALAGDGAPAGTPILMTRNDYDRGLMNGDQGVVVWAAADDAVPSAPWAIFERERGLCTLPLPTLRGAIGLAYATTVHKAQGSEVDHAALILPERDVPLLCRELVYTAVTRARRSVTVVGDRALLDLAIARPLERSSGLAERLAARGAFDPGRAGR